MVEGDSQASRRAPLQRGDVVGRYVIIDVADAPDGSGQASYEAFDPELDRRVALKVMSAVALDPDRVLQQRRLQREAQAMARVSHPNVLAVHDVGEHDGQLFVAMEHVEGMTLRGWLAEQARPWQEVLDAFVAAGRGLVAAHERKLVHRDFTPDNVIVTDDGRICVWGFGSVRAMVSRSPPGSQERRLSADMVFVTQLTRREEIIGSPEYTAPEQQQGDKVTAAADQFSFCVALYEALFGAHPFVGDSTADRRLAAMQGRVEPVGRNDVPLVIRRAIDRGLAPEPHLRHGSMSELIDVLTTGNQRRRRLIAAGAVVGLGLAAAGGLWLHRHNAEQACFEQAASVQELWNDEARAALLRSLEDTGSLYAQLAYEQAELELDSFAEAWHAARLDVCLAELDERVPPDQVRAAVACLDQQVAALDAQAALLPEITRDYIYSSNVALRRSRRPAACLDYELVARQVTPSQTALDAELEARRLYWRGTILEKRTKWDEATALYVQARDLAEQAGTTATLAAAHRGLGTVANAKGDYVRAREELEHAFELAVGVGADDEAGDAARTLTTLVGFRMGRAHAGLAWGALAETYFDLAGIPDDALRRAWLLEDVGVVEQQLDPESAVLKLERAHAMTLEVLGEGHPEPARVLNNLANALLETSRFDEAQVAYEKVIARQRLLFGPRHPYVADATYNLGLALRLQGELDQAEVYFDSALELRREVLPADHPALAVSYIGIAQLEAERRNFDVMIEATEKADSILAKRPSTMRRAIMLTIAAQGLMDDRPTLARRYAERAIEISSALDPTGASAPATDMRAVLALVLAAQGEVAEAREVAQRTLDDAVARGATPKELAMCYAVLANVSYAARELSEARRYADLGAPLDPAAVAILADVALMMGDADAAIALVEPVLPVTIEAGDVLVAHALRVALARARIANGELERAGRLLDEIADRARYGMSERLATSVHVLWAEIHRQRGELESARARLDRIAKGRVVPDDPATADMLAKLRTELID